MWREFCGRDDLLERSIARAKATRSVSLLRVENTGCFQRKRGLPSSRLTKAGQVSVAVSDRNYLSRSATLLYLIWSSGQVVKFSFLLTFLRK